MKTRISVRDLLADYGDRLVAFHYEFLADYFQAMRRCRRYSESEPTMCTYGACGWRSDIYEVYADGRCLRVISMGYSPTGRRLSDDKMDLLRGYITKYREKQELFKKLDVKIYRSKASDEEKRRLYRNLSVRELRAAKTFCKNVEMLLM